MNIKRFVVHFYAVCTALLVSSATLSAALEFPERPITIVVPFPPGGGVDMVARIAQPFMQKLLGQPIIVINKPGGGGLIAGEFLARSKPDGYTVGLFATPTADPELYSYFRQPLFKYSDLLPVVRLRFEAYGLISKSDAPWRNLAEFLSYAKAHPRTMAWGHQGIGHPYHLKGVSLARENGLEMTDVPYKGSKAEILALIGGEINVAIVSVPSVKGMLDEGRIRMLAVQHYTRLPSIPNVPTFLEVGQDVGFPLLSSALLAPRGTPEKIIKILHDATKKTLEDENFLDLMLKGGHNVLYGSAEDFNRDIGQTRKIYTGLFKSMGLIGK